MRYKARIKGKGTVDDPYVTPRLPPGSRIVERKGDEIIFEYPHRLEGYEVVRTHRKKKKKTSSGGKK